MGASSSNHDDDSIDDLLRVAMKTLDDQVPSGYFEGLPNQTLVRLEGSSMQTSSSSGTQLPVTETPPTDKVEGKDRDEDSGLHDIRNLASSARMRLSSRRLGTNPPPVDEDVLAASSGSWKAVALPEPAKMVSLPELESLPSKSDIKAQIKAEKAAAKARKSRPSGELAVEAAAASASLPSVGPAPVAVVDAPLHLDEEIPSIAKGTAKGATSTAVPVAMPMIGSRIAGANKPVGKKNRAALIGSIGVALAAAAGVVVYVQTQNKSADTVSPASEGASRAPAEPSAAPAAPTPSVQSIATDDKAAEAKGAAGADDTAKLDTVEEPAADLADPATAEPKHIRAKTTDKKPAPKKIIEVKGPGDGIPPPKKSEKPTKEPSASKDPNEPSFDELLKEAGYKETKKKVKLDKKSLTASDFKTGMANARPKALACYNGTQGLANVKLVIAPSGQVTKVTVTGPFAGTPVAGCVQAAVKGVTFPAWDGAPQSFGYSFLLSE